MTFIDETADFILSHYREEATHLAVVLPGRRSSLFLRKAIAAKAKAPMLLPDVLSIEDYIFTASGLMKADEPVLLTSLYQVYRENTGDAAYPLDEFLHTGKSLLADFNDVDDYLLPADEIFTYLFRVKEIEGWEPGNAKTDLQSNYLRFYSLLLPMYEVFTQRMLDSGIAWQGLASKKLSSMPASASKYKKVIFAGLNAITPSLAAHINTLRESEMAVLLWDDDPWYTKSKIHEAGHFMRLNQITWPDTFTEKVSHFSSNSKSIEFVGAPMGFAQIQAALTLVEEKYPEQEGDTVIVLADDGLLMPLLSCIPSHLSEKVNISAGYPLKNSLTGQLFISLIDLYSQAFGTNGKEVVFRYDALLKVLTNPLLYLMLSEEKRDIFSKVLDNISSGNIRFFRQSGESNQQSAIGQINELIPDFLSEPGHWTSCLERFDNLGSDLFEVTVDAELEHEAAWMVTTAARMMGNHLKKVTESDNISLQAVLWFMKRQLTIAKIPLKGEPLKGIQILGMLETRALDFKNVIVVGVNEGFLPASAHSDSFIPFDIRRETGLPLPYERDAVYAYHFYRLIQRANEITLIYNTESDPMFGKEPSRFLAQIEHELIPAYPQYRFNKVVPDIQYQKQHNPSFPKPNHETIQQVLDQAAQFGLSFSRLFTFISCPYKFLLASILDIREYQNESGNMANYVMGNVFHQTIEQISKPFVGTALGPEQIDLMITNIEKELAEALDGQHVSHTESGYNFLVTDLLKDSLKRWLTGIKMYSLSGYTIVDVESDLSYEITTEFNKKVRLYGKADRIELVNGAIRIMDFKTTHKRTDLNVPAPEEMTKIIQNDKQYLLQLLFYTWLYCRKNEITSASAGIYPVLAAQNYKPDLLSINKQAGSPLGKEELDAFETAILSVVNRIFDPDQSFSAEPSKNACNNCVYKNVLCFNNRFEQAQDDELENE